MLSEMRKATVLSGSLTSALLLVRALIYPSTNVGFEDASSPKFNFKALSAVPPVFRDMKFVTNLLYVSKTNYQLFAQFK